MDLGWEAHFRWIVIPAWQAYLAAEARLSAALSGSDEYALTVARYDALREAGAAAFYTTHYADLVAVERPPQLPKGVEDVREVRDWISKHCFMLRSEYRVNDVNLLADVADALKHAELTRRLEEREVATKDAVIRLGSGFGTLRPGEGKFGGVEQVLVLARSEERAISSVLQNVIDAWRTAMRWPLPPIGEANAS